MNSKATQDEDVVLKERGNELFSQKKYNDAMQCYSSALKKSNQNDRHRQAIYYSNRSNCHFELGDYENSIVDANECLDLVSSLSEVNAKTENLRHKNLWRLIRASFYLGQDVSSELNELVDCPEKTYSTAACRMRDQIQHSMQSPSSGSTTMTFLRSNLNEPAKEFFTYGHDDVTSALTEGTGAGLTPQPVRLANLLDKDDSSPLLLSFLFGGVGDARHVFTTIMDVHHQLSHLSAADQKKFQFHLTLNDIKPAVLARDLTFLLVLVRLGKFEAHECIATDPEAGMWATVMHYLYLGHVMPPHVHEKFREILQELLSFGGSNDFSKAYPFLHLSNEADWEKLCFVWRYWLEEGTDEYAFPSLKTVLRDHVSPGLQSHELMFEDWKRENPEMVARIESLKQARREEKRQEMRESLLRQSASPSSDFYHNVRERLGPNPTEAEVQRHIHEIVESISDDVMDANHPFAALSGLELERAFLRETHALLPPSARENANSAGPVFEAVHDSWAQAQQLEEELFASAKGRRGNGSSDELSPATITLRDKSIEADQLHNKTIEESRRSVKEDWRVNPMFYDPYWFNLHFAESKQEFNPIDEFCREFIAMSESYMTEKPKDVVDTSSKLFLFTSLFFWNTAFALSQLVYKECLQLEISISPINGLARSIRADPAVRQNKGWPTMYHRIFTSNIADYTGILSMFVDVMPLLHGDEFASKVETYLGTNVLYNNTLWDDYAHFVYSSTAIPTFKEVETILGFNLQSKNDVWEDQHYWTWSNGSTASRDELTEWLHRLYVLIALPAVRNPKNQVREECPNTAATFVAVCDFLIRLRGYPAHWVVSAIDSILQGNGKKFKTLSRPPHLFPNRYEQQNEHQVVDLSSFSLELETQLALWMQLNGPGPLCTVKLTSSCHPIHRYAFKGDFSRNGMGFFGHTESPNARCIGLLLERERPTDETDDMLRMFESLIGRSGSQSKPVRPDILAKGSKQFIVLSCVEYANNWSTKLATVTCWMSAKDYERFKNFYASPIRTDSWKRLRSTERVVQLRDFALVE